MQHLQFISITPEQQKDEILQGIKLQLDELRKEFQPKTPTEYLTRAEVAKMLKIDLSSVHNWGKSGKLIRHAIGNRIYFKRSEVEAAIIKL